MRTHLDSRDGFFLHQKLASAGLKFGYERIDAFVLLAHEGAHFRHPCLLNLLDFGLRCSSLLKLSKNNGDRASRGHGCVGFHSETEGAKLAREEQKFVAQRFSIIWTDVDRFRGYCTAVTESQLWTFVQPPETIAGGSILLQAVASAAPSPKHCATVALGSSGRRLRCEPASKLFNRHKRYYNLRTG
jgi:hypothetical protein